MHAPRPIHRYDQTNSPSALTAENDQLAIEAPLEIRVRGQAVSVSMRTPLAANAGQNNESASQNDAELAAGFLLGEGVIQSIDDLHAIEPCAQPNTAQGDGNVLNVFLKPHVEFDTQKLTRHVFASSSCGVCGKATIDALFHQFEPVTTNCLVRADDLLALPEALRQHQAAFTQTGGLHAAALYTTTGEHICTREDIGRHNAADKVIGAALLQDQLPLDQHVLMLSGRAPFEIIQKAISASIPIIAAIGAPSTLAVELADEFGVTLIGFLRDKRFNIYSHAHRVSAV